MESTTENEKMQDKTLYARYYEIGSGWAWYITDENKNTNMAFGYVVCSFGGKWDSFDLEKIKQKFNLKQDENFEQIRFGDFQHDSKGGTSD